MKRETDHLSTNRPLMVSIMLLCLHSLASLHAQDQPPRSTEQTRQIKQAVIEAFAETHEGWSSDELLIRDDLRDAFQRKCKQAFPDGEPVEFNWLLLNLRKANQLSSPATRRNNADDTLYRHAAEIAIRSLHDRQSVSIDRIMADPALRAEFDELAGSLAGEEVTAYQLRKSALKLRKARQLRPELILRIADWGREIETLSAEKAAGEIKLIPQSPGIYIFFDDTGYLYVGESGNLRDRLKKHLDESDSLSLAKYLKENDREDVSIEIHAFDPESQARRKPVRRAYESELIRSRKPRLNLAP